MMPAVRVLIADDEPLARQGLRIMLQEENGVGEVREARSGGETVAAIRTHRPDLVLLDVQMPKLDGFGVVEQVGPRQMPAVVFVTAHDQYAIRAFEMNAVDYLLKPVARERFHRAFQRACAQLLQGRNTGDVGQQMLALLETLASPRKWLQRLAIRTTDRVLFVDVETIDWIEAAENYVCVHAGTATHMLYVPISTLESSLDPGIFMRIHRSAIVNLRRIKQLWPSSHGQYLVELHGGARLQSGRTYHDRIKTLATNPF